jgi:hypothetical protein
MRFVRVLLLWVLAVPCLAQTIPVTTSVTATSTCVPIRASNNSTVGIIISGTWSGTFTPNLQISTASGAPTASTVVTGTAAGSAPQTTITANGGYTGNIGGFTQFNLCSTGTWTSGTAIVTLYSTPALMLSRNGSAPCLWTTFPTTGGTGNTLSGTANKATLWKVWNPAACTTSAVTYDVGTADNSANTYDLGLYNSSGGLIVHLGSTAGSTFAASTGVKDASWAAAASLAPGVYYIALTSSCTSACVTLAGASSNAIARETNTTVNVTAGGTLNSSVTPPADSSSGGAQIPALIVR